MLFSGIASGEKYVVGLFFTTEKWFRAYVRTPGLLYVQLGPFGASFENKHKTAYAEIVQLLDKLDAQKRADDDLIARAVPGSSLPS
jgi:hypothetical protein